MAYVITEACVGAECGVCLDVCPVDAIHPTAGEARAAEQLSINPDSCIHCSSCARVCPLKAAVAGAELPPLWARLNSDSNSTYRQF